MAGHNSAAVSRPDGSRVRSLSGVSRVNGCSVFCLQHRQEVLHRPHLESVFPDGVRNVPPVRRYVERHPQPLGVHLHPTRCCGVDRHEPELLRGCRCGAFQSGLSNQEGTSVKRLPVKCLLTVAILRVVSRVNGCSVRRLSRAGSDENPDVVLKRPERRQIQLDRVERFCTDQCGGEEGRHQDP